ncbi:hypothetical protein ACFQY4_14855 [Catellatospora bangladeshensis]|uniref:hypothetical protein n=1 Tax=Catellatospora bangladeshensis TaxID=310355 RepID=UPI003606D4FE
MGGTPDVAEIDAKGSNSLPFLGTASGTLVVAEGTPADRVTELAADLRRYVADQDGVEGRIEADGVAFTVVADKARTDEVVALWRSLTADTRVRRADIDDTAGDGDRWRIDVDTADATEAMAVFRDLLSGGGGTSRCRRRRSSASAPGWTRARACTSRPAATAGPPARRSPRTRPCAPVTRSSKRA